jgi:hypothetical protein
VCRADQRQTAGRQEQASELTASPALIQPQRGEEHGEEGLRLQYQRGQPGGHAKVDGGEQEGELADRDAQSVGKVEPQG